MFTGIIEEIGTLKEMHRQGQTMVLTIQATLVLEDVRLGDSIAINGVCLTVIRFDKHTFAVDVMPETYRLTNLSKLSAGSKVNLERAMSAQGRFGGHIVQGHVDGIGTIASVKKEENAVVYKIKPESASLFQYIIPRGSITLDGISLTVVLAESGFFTVSIIPHTLEKTVLSLKKAGAQVNIECDILGKYVKHLLYRDQGEGRLTEHFLRENGFV